MNDHIKRCILDAGFPKFDKMYVVSDGEELEKFAELIVRECGNIAFEHWAVTHDTSPQEAILQYFEVDA